MTKKKSAPKRPRTDAQIAAEAAYAAAHEVVQVNVKFKAAADVKMFKQLRARFDGESDSAIVRLAVKKLAASKN